MRKVMSIGTGIAVAGVSASLAAVAIFASLKAACALFATILVTAVVLGVLDIL